MRNVLALVLFLLGCGGAVEMERGEASIDLTEDTASVEADFDFWDIPIDVSVNHEDGKNELCVKLVFMTHCFDLPEM